MEVLRKRLAAAEQARDELEQWIQKGTAGYARDMELRAEKAEHENEQLRAFIGKPPTVERALMLERAEQQVTELWDALGAENQADALSAIHALAQSDIALGRCAGERDAAEQRVTELEREIKHWHDKCDEVGIPHDPDVLVKHHRANAGMAGAAEGAGAAWKAKRRVVELERLALELCDVADSMMSDSAGGLTWLSRDPHRLAHAADKLRAALITQGDTR